ncbi:MAG TPA: hypothetical protein VGE62_00775 [Candidatus Paceibacterota bacterium]
MNIASRKIISVTLILAFFFGPLAGPIAYAQTGTGNQQTSQTSQTQQTNVSTFGTVNPGQGTAYQGGAQSGGTTVSASGIATNLVGCSAGALLGQLASYGINKLINSLTDQVKSATGQQVPTDDQGQPQKDIQSNTTLDTSARSGQLIMGVPIGASFDAIAWCLLNGTIEAIADATIAWANSGFEGSPAFLENPETFFQELADIEAQNFISSVAYNTAGYNVCEPFRVELAIGLANSYSNQTGRNRFNKVASCSMDQMQAALMSSSVGYGVEVGGGPGKNKDLTGYWTAWGQARKSQNNVWGSWIAANDFLYGEIEKKGNTVKFELGLNNGWLNFARCEDQEAAKKGDRSSCKTYTPGSLVQSSLEKNLDIPKDRLVMAQKFDQVISAVIENLIKVALNKVLEE